MADDTRDLINNAEALLKKNAPGAKDPADAAPPSTKQLVVDAEKLIGRRSSRSKLVPVLIGAAVVVAAVLWVTTQGL